MIIDKLLQVSDSQIVTASAPSTDVIDFGQKAPNTGMDGISKLVIVVNQAVAGAPVTFSLQDSDNNVSYTSLTDMGAFAASELPLGKQIVLPLPTRLRRYVRVFYNVVSPLTAGKFSAQIVTGIQQNDPYPDSPRIA